MISKYLNIVPHRIAVYVPCVQMLSELYGSQSIDLLGLLSFQFCKMNLLTLVTIVGGSSSIEHQLASKKWANTSEVYMNPQQ